MRTIKTNITVSVAELFERIKEMKDNGMAFAKLSIEEDDAEEGHLPFCLAIKGAESYENFELQDYEYISALKDLTE